MINQFILGLNVQDGSNLSSGSTPGMEPCRYESSITVLTILALHKTMIHLLREATKQTMQAFYYFLPACLPSSESPRGNTMTFWSSSNVKLLDKNRTNAFWDTPTTTGLSPKTWLRYMSSHKNTQAHYTLSPETAGCSSPVTQCLQGRSLLPLRRTSTGFVCCI